MLVREVIVSRKGQVTIPIEIRKKYGLVAGSKVQISVEDGNIVIRKLPSIHDLDGTVNARAIGTG